MSGWQNRKDELICHEIIANKPMTQAEFEKALTQIASEIDSTVISNGDGTYTVIGPNGEQAFVEFPLDQ
jgi:hypothetical protein